MQPRAITWKAVQTQSAFPCEETCAAAGLRAINTWTDGTLLCRVSRTTGETKRTYLGERYRKTGTAGQLGGEPHEVQQLMCAAGEAKSVLHASR